MRIIETNISYGKSDQYDFQSRVIEIDSWEDYIQEIKENKCVSRNSVIGNLNGQSFPRYFNDFDNLKYDDFHLSYSFTDMAGYKINKLAYIVDR